MSASEETVVYTAQTDRAQSQWKLISKQDEPILGNHASQRLIVRFAGNNGNFLDAEKETNTRQSRGHQTEKIVVEAATATEPKSLIVEGHARYENAIEFRERDAGTTKRIRLTQAEGARHDDVIPTRDLVPVKLGRDAMLDHQRQNDAFALRPGFLNEQVDVRLRGQRSEERNAPAFEKGWQVRGYLADDEGGFGVECWTHSAQERAHLAPQLFLG
jgi:hypothetical protein